MEYLNKQDVIKTILSQSIDNTNIIDSIISDVNNLHTHSIPDFTNEQLYALLKQIDELTSKNKGMLDFIHYLDYNYFSYMTEDENFAKFK